MSILGTYSIKLDVHTVGQDTPNGRGKLCKFLIFRNKAQEIANLFDVSTYELAVHAKMYTKGYTQGEHYLIQHFGWEDYKNYTAFFLYNEISICGVRPFNRFFLKKSIAHTKEGLTDGLLGLVYVKNKDIEKTIGVNAQELSTEEYRNLVMDAISKELWEYSAYSFDSVCAYTVSVMNMQNKVIAKHTSPKGELFKVTEYNRILDEGFAKARELVNRLEEDKKLVHDIQIKSGEDKKPVRDIKNKSGEDEKPVRDIKNE